MYRRKLDVFLAKSGGLLHFRMGRWYSRHIWQPVFRGSDSQGVLHLDSATLPGSLSGGEFDYM